MNITINKYDFFILLEPYIDDLELHSPLYEFIVNSPIEKWDNVDLGIKKQELGLMLSEKELTDFKKIVHVLNKPDFEYEISWEIENEKLLNYLYERDGGIVEFLFDADGKFELTPPNPHQDKLTNYLKLIDLSEYKVDSSKAKHILSFDEYLVLNIAFALVEMFALLDPDIEDSDRLFTVQDIIDEFEDNSDYKSVQTLFLMASIDEEEIHGIDISNCVKSLIEKGYFSQATDKSLSLGTNSISLYSNLFKLNTVKFSFHNKKYINEYENALLKYGVFISSKESIFYQYFENKNVVIETISSRTELEEKFMKAFDF